MDAAGTQAALERTIAVTDAIPDWTPETLEPPLRALAEELGVKAGQLFTAIRVAVTGRTASPPLFDTLAVLGRERCLSRMRSSLVA
jgi:glutamyl-tRNA synthetase